MFCKILKVFILFLGLIILTGLNNMADAKNWDKVFPKSEKVNIEKVLLKTDLE